MKATVPTFPLRSDTLEVNGRLLSHGDEFTVRGEGRFSFRYGWNGDCTAWGPITNPQQAQMRTFRIEAIATIHNKKVTHP